MSAASAPLTFQLDATEGDACAASVVDSHFPIRIASIFVIFVTTLLGTLPPIVWRKSKTIPRALFDFAKYFGTGVIIATAFVHLLAPAVEELGSPCLSPKWQEYDYAFALAMAAVLAMFFAEVAAYRLGTARLLRLGVRVGEERDEARGSDVEAPANKPDPLAKPVDCDEAACAEPDCIEPDCGDLECCDEDNDSLSQPPSNAEAAAQLIAIGVLEFGIVLHSVIIGLTLAVSDEFIVLFVVIIFHQMFEGPGLGSRLATLPLPKSAGWIRYAGAILYAACTPIGIAVGLGLREGFNGNSGLFNAVAGILDSLSAGILIYTGLVELLAHEVLFNPRMMAAETRQLAYVLGCIALGAGMMALLAKWA